MFILYIFPELFDFVIEQLTELEVCVQCFDTVSISLELFSITLVSSIMNGPESSFRKHKSDRWSLQDISFLLYNNIQQLYTPLVSFTHWYFHHLVDTMCCLGS